MKKNLKKIISLIFVIFWMIIIFWFSAMDGKESNSKSKKTIDNVITEIANVIHINNSEKINLTTLNVYLRKCMHGSVYFILSIFVFNSLRVFGVKRKKSLILTIIILFLYACTDELHQVFVDGRNGKVLDIFIDMIGASIGLVICCIFIYIKKFIDKKKKSCIDLSKK